MHPVGSTDKEVVGWGEVERWRGGSRKGHWMEEEGKERTM